MPNQDRTGPSGQGPQGGGSGRCRGGKGGGRGSGACRGSGQGFQNTPVPGDPAEERIRALEREIAELRQRLAEKE